MNRPTIAAKGVSTSGRTKHTRLRARPIRRLFIDHTQRRRNWRGLSIREIGYHMEGGE